MAAICPNLCSSLNQKPFFVHQPNVVDMSTYSTELVDKLVEFFYTGQLCKDLQKDELDVIKDLCRQLGIILSSENDETKESEITLEVANIDEQRAVSEYAALLEASKQVLIKKEDTDTTNVPHNKPEHDVSRENDHLLINGKFGPPLCNVKWDITVPSVKSEQVSDGVDNLMDHKWKCNIVLFSLQ